MSTPAQYQQQLQPAARLAAPMAPSTGPLFHLPNIPMVTCWRSLTLDLLRPPMGDQRPLFMALTQ